MQHSKFFTLLRSLNKEELNLFQKNLRQLHGNEEIALSLFAYIKKFHPAFKDEKKLDAGYAYQKIFGVEIGKNRKQVLNALSDLHGWLKDFLLSEKATKGAFEGRFLWLTILQERGLQDEFLRQFPRLQNDLENLSQKSATDYFTKAAVNHFVYEHLTQSNLKLENEVIERHSDDLDISYAIVKLKIACEKANRKNVLLMTFEPEILPEVVESSGTKALTSHPLLLLYREVYQLVAAHRDDAYDRVEALLRQYADGVAPSELGTMLIYLHNYVSAQIRTGKDEFWEKTHRLNKFSVEHGVFASEATMSTTQFNNIVSVACNAQDLDWATLFVAQQNHLLPERIRAEAVLLANSTICFEQKEFKKVIKLLEKKDFEDLLDDIRSKALLLKSCYEIGEEQDKALDTCFAFESLLIRHRAPKKEAVEASLNFVRILKIMLQKRTGKEAIIKRIENAKPLYFKSWLLGQLSRYKAEFAAQKQKK